jgi:hypothetical protein
VPKLIQIEPREMLPSSGSVTSELISPPARAIVSQMVANSAAGHARSSATRPRIWMDMALASAVAPSPWASRSWASTLSNRSAPSPPYSRGSTSRK